MKVIFLTYSPSPYRIDFFEELGKLVELTVCFEINSKKDRIKNGRASSWYCETSNNFKSIYLKNKRILKKEYSTELIKIIKKDNYDIIVIGGYNSPTAMITMRYLKKNHIEFILSTDGGFPKYNENIIKNKVKKHFISMANYYLSTGENANNYLKYYGAKEENIFNYPFTSMKESDLRKKVVDNKSRKKIRAKLSIDNKITFTTIGRFIKRKGFDIFLKAAKGLDNAQFIIIGDKPTEEYLKIVEELNLKNVKFVDFKPKKELIEYFEATDVFVLPTREDIWGLVINEALSIGLPVITTNNCGAGLDLIQNDYNGFLINSEDIDELHKKMLFFINNKNRILEMSNNALESVKKYTIENEAKVHYDVFSTIINKKNRRD